MQIPNLFLPVRPSSVWSRPAISTCGRGTAPSSTTSRAPVGSTCCRKETGKTITQLLKELDEQEAAAAAEQQEPDTQA